MIENPSSSDGGEHPPPGSNRARLADAVELLNARRYKRVQQLLQEQQEAAQRSGQMAMVVILAAAHQLCLSCRQFQADRQLHQLGLEEAERREQESRIQIRAVLTMVSQLVSLETPQAENDISDLLLPARLEPPQHDETESAEKPSLMQKVKHLLGSALNTPLAKFNTGAEQEDQEPEASADEQPDSAIALRYLARELEMLEKSGQSLSAEQKILQRVASSLTASSEQEDITLESIAYMSHVVKSQQAPPQSLQDEGTEEVDGVATSDEPSKTASEEEPTLNGSPDVIQSFEQTLSMGFADISSGQFDDVVVGGDKVSPTLVVHCLGPFQVYANDEPIDKWPSSKGKSIFKYMINNRERPVAKEVLMDLFWPDADPDAARNNLNVAIYGLRQAFRNGESDFSHVLYRDGHYLLNPDIRVWLDVEAFTTHFQNGRRLQAEGSIVEAAREFHAAEVLYQGEFLEEDRYEEWLMPLRRQLTNYYLELLSYLNQYYFDLGEYTACITICRSMLAIDPCLEDTHGCLMRCHYRQGQQHLAIRQYHQCVKALQEELEMPPGPGIEELYDKIRQHQAI